MKDYSINRFQKLVNLLKNQDISVDDKKIISEMIDDELSSISCSIKGNCPYVKNFEGNVETWCTTCELLHKRHFYNKKNNYSMINVDCPYILFQSKVHKFSEVPKEKKLMSPLEIVSTKNKTI